MAYHFVAHPIAAKKFFRDGIGLKPFAIMGCDRFVELRIELLPDGSYRLHAHSGKHFVDLLRDKDDALEKLFELHADLFGKCAEAESRARSRLSSTGSISVARLHTWLTNVSRRSRSIRTLKFSNSFKRCCERSIIWARSACSRIMRDLRSFISLLSFWSETFGGGFAATAAAGCSSSSLIKSGIFESSKSALDTSIRKVRRNVQVFFLGLKLANKIIDRRGGIAGGRFFAKLVVFYFLILLH